jgi:outer membrane protein, multidrug efflux system
MMNMIRNFFPSRRQVSAHLGVFVTVAGLAACANVGPDYHGAPTVPAVRGYFARAGSDADAHSPLPARWWENLGDARLDQLIGQALTDSPNIEAARARLRAARAGLQGQRAALRPSGSASTLDIGLQTAPGTSDSRTLHLYTTSFMASWEVDLFGSGRRSVEASQADSEAVAADLADLQVALAADVAQNYIRLREQQLRLQLLDTAQQAARTALDLTRQRQRQGVATEQDTQQRVGQLADATVRIEETRGDILQSLDQLALLCGQGAAALDGTLQTPEPLPTLPAALPIGDPTRLLQNRPDIRAAERRLAASQAQIGIKKADYFPKLTLMGGMAYAAQDRASLYERSSASIIGLPYLSWNIFDFGRTAAAVDKAESSRDEALAQYRGKVLQALDDANSALSRFGQQRQKVQQLETRLAATERQWQMTLALRRAGVASAIELAERSESLSDDRRQTLAARAELLGDYVLLQKSLGLGWQDTALD